MIALFTDFGLQGPYMGQMRAAIAAIAPSMPVIDLFADAPMFNAKHSAYLLAAHVQALPVGSVVVAVVDPGVGTQRAPIILRAGGRVFVGPENGLLAILARRQGESACRIDWQPPFLSNSFHGRDLFAPVAAKLALGLAVAQSPVPLAAIDRADWPEDLAELIYQDHYGNIMTGIRAASLRNDVDIDVDGHHFYQAPTFGAVSPGAAFWYENSNGLVEIAINQGRAADLTGLSLGTPVTMIPRRPPSFL